MQESTNRWVRRNNKNKNKNNDNDNNPTSAINDRWAECHPVPPLAEYCNNGKLVQYSYCTVSSKWWRGTTAGVGGIITTDSCCPSGRRWEANSWWAMGSGRSIAALALALTLALAQGQDDAVCGDDNNNDGHELELVTI
jgi:hypothetical protein